MKKILILSVCLFAALSLFSCGDDKEQTSAIESTTETTTMGTKLFVEFEKEIKKSDDLVKVAEAITSSPVCEYSCIVSEVESGYLPGFSTDIAGFTKAVAFMPMIGSIPFVGYIFQCDNPEDFKTKLLETCDPRWNICTQADETLCEVSGKYVFFVMCPGEEYID